MNRTYQYGTHKNLYIDLFLLLITILFGSIHYGPPLVVLLFITEKKNTVPGSN